MVSDTVSALLGAPPGTWKQKETEQMKHIQRCYKNAFAKDERDELTSQVDLAEVSERDAFAMLFGHNVPSLPTADKDRVKDQTIYTPEEVTTKSEESGQSEKGKRDAGSEDIRNTEGRRDEEWFLPKNSPLRSKDGDLQAPLNVPFKDHNSFLQSCEFDQWREIFDQPSQDHFLSEVARSLVANICTSQARKELRVRHGSIPGGRVLRKKREHIVPLTLVLHELKLWAAHKLRSASVFEEETYKDVRRRIRYIEALSQKEVWGDPAAFLQAGMRPVAHDKLFRLFLTAKEDLKRAEEYAYRGYCRRSSREKLKRLSNLMKEVILREIRLLSDVFTLNSKLSDAKTRRLQPLALLNELHNQGFVDYGNFVNVCMYELFQMKLVQAALTSDYDNPDFRDSLEDLATWTSSNLFCSPGARGNDPFFHLNEETGLPTIYAGTALKLKEKLKEIDPHALAPLAPEKHVKILKKCFHKKETVSTIMKYYLKVAAAVQDLIPGLFATYKLWAIAGDGGDFTVYDTLRAQVINVMSNTISRVYAVQTTSKLLLKKLGELAKEDEDIMEKRRLKTRKAEYKPAWISNFYYLRTEVLPQEQKGFTEAFKQLWEIAKDAWEYSLTAEQLDDKVTDVRRLCDAITGTSYKDDSRYRGVLKTSDVIRINTETDWLNSKNTTFAQTSSLPVSRKVENLEADSDKDEISETESNSDNDS